MAFVHLLNMKGKHRTNSIFLLRQSFSLSCKSLFIEYHQYLINLYIALHSKEYNFFRNSLLKICVLLRTDTKDFIWTSCFSSSHIHLIYFRYSPNFLSILRHKLFVCFSD
uniref:Uncharacterized protein n=1 Tax=Micrurus lemniscatus lemniscatus TaxID=129467 RepID=A0A2D4HF47_MICLE